MINEKIHQQTLVIVAMQNRKKHRTSLNSFDPITGFIISYEKFVKARVHR